MSMYSDAEHESLIAAQRKAARHERLLEAWRYDISARFALPLELIEGADGVAAARARYPKR